MKKSLLISSMLLSIIYIFYRVAFSLPFSFGFVPIFLSLILLFFEICDTWDFFLFCFNNNVDYNSSATKKSKVDATISNLPHVDILIATVNEDLDIINDTIDSCLKLDYPKNLIHIYVCDDGHRSTVKEMCLKKNINYISRKNLKYYKAGNYNNALSLTNSPYIATFDADMMPTPDFLKIVIHYIQSLKNVGFVQLPQSFYNPDIYQYRLHLDNLIPFDQEYFYNNIQIKSNSINCPICCGTNVVYSREALESVGGFAINTISEDIATGMLIQNNNYNCVALSNIAAYGSSVLDYDGFIKQKFRWSVGCMQMAKHYNIFKLSGLSIMQKLKYLSCVQYWLFGLKRLFFILFPAILIIFNIPVLSVNNIIFFIIWFMLHFSRFLVIHSEFKNNCSIFFNIVKETILAPSIFCSLLYFIFNDTNSKFYTTPKKYKKKKLSCINILILIFHIILLIFNLSALAIIIVNMYNVNTFFYIFPFILVLFSVLVLIVSILFDINNEERKCDKFVPNRIKYYSFKNIINYIKYK